MILWGTVYTSLGWIFAADVEPVIAWVTGNLRLVGPLLLVGLVGAALLRWWKAGMHDHAAAADRR
ncbi:MAG: hypothetical protein U5R14_12835 [Gemmatimonadota bacterium]|nr:hypothetical protein [Gemmatimonadota bacterium]